MEFGSGFKIAMRDLEIRGAGNLLGPEQSGYLMSVGYDPVSYTHLLCRFVGSNYVEILILPDSDSGQSPLRCNYLSSRQATPGSS